MTEFFAEIGSNHNQDIGRANALISAAKHIGCKGVKFQYFRADKLWHPSMKKELQAAKLNELKLTWIPELSDYARSLGLLFGLSVFDIPSIEAVNDHIDYYKIASFEAGWLDLVRTVYKKNKRTMISVGQSSKQEILEIIQNLPPQNNRIDILHCVSEYPAYSFDCNLGIIRDNNRIINGWSDHTKSPLVMYAAVACGADVIEFHLDLGDCLGVEYRHSWHPYQIKNVIRNIEIMNEAIGTKDWDTFSSEQDRKYKANKATGLRGEK